MNKSFLLILFFVINLAFIVFGGRIFDNELGNVSQGVCGAVNMTIADTSEILILGSSRAKHHYDCSVIDDLTGKSCYNGGVPGMGLPFSYALLKERIKNRIPETVVFDLSPNVVVDPNSSRKLLVLAPYNDKNNAFREILEENEDFNIFYKYFSLVSFNSTLYDIIFLRVDEENTNGYYGIKGEIDVNNIRLFKLEEDFVIDDFKLEYFNKIIDLCLKNNITLKVVVSPTYEKFDPTNKLISEFNSIADTNNIMFFDYSSWEGVYGDPTSFKDQLHLNSKGASSFSNMIASDIVN